MINQQKQLLSLYSFAASGYLLDPSCVERAQGYLASRDCALTLDPTVLFRFERFAGSEAERHLAILNAASQITDIRLFARGGYGLTRLLPQLRVGHLLNRTLDKGGAWCGYSDATALLLALLAAQIRKYGHYFRQLDTAPVISTFIGPMLAADFGHHHIDKVDQLDDFTWQHFYKAVKGEAIVWRSPPLKSPPQKPPLNVIVGRLWGGNLAIINSLLGTPYFPKVDGGILFIEDINEHPYRIERMVLQLMQAGVLAKQQALLIGGITDYKLAPSDNGYDFEAMVAYLRKTLKIPVLTGLQTGHHRGILTLPLGYPVEIKSLGESWQLKIPALKSLKTF